MKKYEEFYLVTLIGTLICLFLPVAFYIYMAFYKSAESVLGESYGLYSSLIFPSLAAIGSFLYLRRRGVPGKTCCLFLLLNPPALYLGFLCLWGIDLLL